MAFTGARANRPPEALARAPAARLYAHRYLAGHQPSSGASADSSGPDAGQSEPPAEEGKGERIAILCGGPSLREVWSDEMGASFDLVVGVNSTAFIFRVDWMVACDSPLIRRLLAGSCPKPRKGVVTYHAYLRELRKAGIGWAPMVTVPKVKPYSAPRAIRWALNRSPASVELFGVDFSEHTHDVAGVKGDHGPRRWMQEAEAFRAVWDRRIVAVHGAIQRANNGRLAYIRGEVAAWPG